MGIDSVTDSPAAAAAPTARTQSPAMVVGAASLGTMFEWYDFFLYGSLATFIARHFFAAVGEATAFIFALIAFGAGFVARPFGAAVFGRLGDLVGRKRTFLVTMALMGVSTFLVGLLPGYDVIGVAAPAILVGLRLLQGLALGGEYGGAAIYVAEHAPAERRGLYTSWINAMATLGLISSLAVIIGLRLTMPEEDFAAWGWRIPFLLSVLLLAVSLWIRMRLSESPVFQRMKEEGATATAPLAEAVSDKANLGRMIAALFGVIAGGTTIWYTAHFYPLFFLDRVLKVDALLANALLAVALCVALPSYLFFGWLSDRIGRKIILMGGAALAALTIMPAYQLLTEAANPALAQAQRDAPVVVYADPAACSVQFDPIGRGSFNTSDCDIAKAFLTRAGVSYESAPAPTGSRAEIHVGERIVQAPDPIAFEADLREAAIASFHAGARQALDTAGYPSAADPARINRPLVVAVILYLVLLATMTYAPVSAFLVELFPARIRYTSLSLPYHLGTGWIGGFMPATAFAIVAANGDIYSGLWYPVFFAGLSVVVGVLALPETRCRAIS
jgi:MFS family permease